MRQLQPIPTLFLLLILMSSAWALGQEQPGTASEDFAPPLLQIVPDTLSPTTAYGIPWQAYKGEEAVSPVAFYHLAGDSLRADSVEHYITHFSKNQHWDKLYHRFDSGFGTFSNLQMYRWGPVGAWVGMALWVPSKLIWIGSMVFLSNPEPCDAIQLDTATNIAKLHNETVTTDIIADTIP